MKVTPSALPEVLVLEPQVFGDERGFFLESWNARTFQQATGLNVSFVQDNHSRSTRDVLRGIHYQLVQPQGKLVRVVTGSVFDVAVDLRRDSPHFGHWAGVELSEQNQRQLWIPPGFGHAFLVLSERTDFLYKTTAFWSAEHERSIAWNDLQIGIDWPLQGRQPVLATKDRNAALLADAVVY